MTTDASFEMSSIYPLWRSKKPSDLEEHGAADTFCVELYRFRAPLNLVSLVKEKGTENQSAGGVLLGGNAGGTGRKNASEHNTLCSALPFAPGQSLSTRAREKEKITVRMNSLKYG